MCVPCPRGGKERRGGERGPRSYLKVLTKAGLVYSTSVYLRRTSTLQPRLCGDQLHYWHRITGISALLVAGFAGIRNAPVMQLLRTYHTKHTLGLGFLRLFIPLPGSALVEVRMGSGAATRVTSTARPERTSPTI